MNNPYVTTLGFKVKFLKINPPTLTEEKFQRQQNFKIFPKISVNARGLEVPRFFYPLTPIYVNLVLSHNYLNIALKPFSGCFKKSNCINYHF